ncbi:TetR/AcrR family transcriptional regulator [Streptomyces sp. NPDC012825]|uniref:TetR/AcrR family transcriptional regulator n=1 Tax=Streptomyces sp. NPDC012825 TaxID=3364851 RepID=UPI0036A8626C
MTPIRHNHSGRTEPDRSDRHRSDTDLLLDAARDCVLAVGVRRTTLTDVARRAGVSRMTLYRRWPDVRSLVGDLMTREWIAVATDAVPVGADGGPVRARLVDGLVAAAAALRSHPLFHKILDVDPELLLPYVLDRRGASQEAFLGLLVTALGAGHEDGSVRGAPVDLQARSLLLVVQSFTLSLRTMTEETDPDLSEAAFLGELRTLLERTLTP